METHQKIIDHLYEILAQINTANGYQTDFDDVRIWDDIPTHYSKNEIILRDPRVRFDKQNKYVATVRIEIIAIVLETAVSSASKLGNIALVDLIEAVSKFSLCRSMLTLVESEKFIETKGKTACEIELTIDVKFQF